MSTPPRPEVAGWSEPANAALLLDHVLVDAALGGRRLDQDKGIEGLVVVGGGGQEAIGGLLGRQGVVLATGQLDDG